MDVVKTIINAETNTKFIKVYKNGFMEIPDVIYHILSKDGKYIITGSVLNTDYPRVNCFAEEDESALSGFLDNSHLDDYLDNVRQLEDDQASIDEVKTFVREAKKVLPYLRFDKSVEVWMREHQTS